MGKGKPLSVGIQAIKHVNEGCLSPAAESFWLCLKCLPEKKLSARVTFQIPAELPTVLSPCTSASWISSGNLPFVCSLTGHTQHCLDMLQLQLDWHGIQQEWYLGSTFSSTITKRTARKWKFPNVGERWLRRTEQHLGNRSPTCKVGCMRKQSPSFASFISTTQGMKPTTEDTSSISNPWQWAETLPRHCTTWSFHCDNL